ncbi:DAK2 domain-containing protein [Christensenellaceae bacterium OttesenSCG-928-K19]|nr:DAK2 domain-containing protein [Christensenellaceae bacterium OttesenSCG-928-K19]
MDKTYLLRLLQSLKKVMGENRDYLIELDSVVGDGDLGLTMGDGFAAAYDAVADTQENDLGKILYQAGKAMSTAVPSTMGTLMASGLMSAGKVLKGKESTDMQGIHDLFAAYEEGVAKRGKANVGDKTFLDGLHPAVVSLGGSVMAGEALPQAAQKAYEAAEKGYHDTKGMLAVHGRAATRGEASRELEDPGAAVAMLMMKALARSAG